MSALADMSAAGMRILDLLTYQEAAARLPRGRRSVKAVRSLVAEGVLVEERFGALVRITPESVAAYVQRQAAGEGPCREQLAAVRAQAPRVHRRRVPEHGGVRVAAGDTRRAGHRREGGGRGGLRVQRGYGRARPR